MILHGRVSKIEDFSRGLNFTHFLTTGPITAFYLCKIWAIILSDPQNNEVPCSTYMLLITRIVKGKGNYLSCRKFN